MSEPKYKSVADLLGNLLGHGVYAIGLVDELRPFGFLYGEGMLQYGTGSVELYARTQDKVALDMGNDKSGGMLNSGIPDDLLIVDALDLSIAIFQLMAPGQKVPSSMYFGRGRGYRANVDAIARLEQANSATRKANHLD